MDSLFVHFDILLTVLWFQQTFCPRILVGDKFVHIMAGLILYKDPPQNTAGGEPRRAIQRCLCHTPSPAPGPDDVSVEKQPNTWLRFNRFQEMGANCEDKEMLTYRFVQILVGAPPLGQLLVLGDHTGKTVTLSKKPRGSIRYAVYSSSNKSNRKRVCFQGNKVQHQNLRLQWVLNNNKTSTLFPMHSVSAKRNIIIYFTCDEKPVMSELLTAIT